MKFATRGPEFGNCNICGAYGKLTEDHTPPKGAAKITGVMVNTLTEILNIDKPSRTHRPSQNGIKFRSLCKICNNTRLGSNYDLELIQFSQNVKSLLTSSVELPNVIYIKGKPQKIARAVYGHLLAIGVEKHCSNARYNALLDWFIDESQPMPKCMRIHYWPYPFRKQYLIREARLLNISLRSHAEIWIMKYFPVSFLIVWDDPKDFQFQNFTNFDRWRDQQPDLEVEMPMYLKNIPSESWPEVPTNNYVLAINHELAVGAAESKPKTRKKYKH